MNIYKEDKENIEKYFPIIELSRGDGRVLLSPDLQGRVLTSSFNAEQGLSMGWVNRELIASGQILPHCNNWGGEERFWLGPEGGQYSLFFAPQTLNYEFEDWQTPSVIDTEAWQLLAATEHSACFETIASLKNHAGTVLQCKLTREVKIENSIYEHVKSVRYSSRNTITNVGDFAWNEETGMPSIWMLGQYAPTKETKIIIPVSRLDVSEINERYFGPIESERLIKTPQALIFTADGGKRGKIGISSRISCSIAGAYDKENNLLTFIEIEKPTIENPVYVNSMWEHQKNPYDGDVINAYNDGPLEDGSIMGPFYELESSSPAAALKPDESITHTQYTTHICGTKEDLAQIAKDKLKVNLYDL